MFYEGWQLTNDLPWLGQAHVPDIITRMDAAIWFDCCPDMYSLADEFSVIQDSSDGGYNETEVSKGVFIGYHDC